MRNKQIPLAILFLLSCLNTRSQDLQLFIGEEVDGFSHIHSPVELSDGGIIAHYIIDGQTSLLRTDEFGQPLWRIETDAALPNELTDLIAAENGSVIVLSRAGNWSDRGFHAAKLASDGTILWSNRYTIESSDWSHANGATGIIRNDGSVDIRTLNYGCTDCGAFYVLRMDGSGIPLGPAYSLPVPYHELDLSEVTLEHDGQERLYIHSPLYGYTGQIAGLTSCFDGTGQPLWANMIRMTNDNWDYSNHRYAVDDAGNSYLLGSQDNDMPGVDVFMYLIKYDPLGNMLFYKLFPSNDDYYLHNIGSFSDIVDGEIHYGNSPRIRFDLDGTMLGWEITSHNANFSITPYDYSLGVSGHERSMDLTKLLLGGHWWREDQLFGYNWTTPVLMRIPYDAENACLFYTDALPALSDTLVPLDFIEITPITQWNQDLVQYNDTIFLGNQLPLPTVTSFCSIVTVDDHDRSSPDILVRPSVLSSGMHAELTLPQKGTYEILDIQGRILLQYAVPLDRHSISSENITPGHYLIRCRTSNGTALGVARLTVE